MVFDDQEVPALSEPESISPETEAEMQELADMLTTVEEEEVPVPILHGGELDADEEIQELSDMLVLDDEILEPQKPIDDEIDLDQVDAEIDEITGMLLEVGSQEPPEFVDQELLDIEDISDMLMEFDGESVEDGGGEIVDDGLKNGLIMHRDRSPGMDGRAPVPGAPPPQTPCRAAWR